jgi:hypothetical protein
VGDAGRRNNFHTSPGAWGWFRLTRFTLVVDCIAESLFSAKIPLPNSFPCEVPVPSRQIKVKR